MSFPNRRMIRTEIFFRYRYNVKAPAGHGREDLSNDVRSN